MAGTVQTREKTRTGRAAALSQGVIPAPGAVLIWEQNQMEASKMLLCVHLSQRKSTLNWSSVVLLHGKLTSTVISI